MNKATITSRNIPFLFDFFFSTHDVTHARCGMGIDAMLIEGGIMLWHGHRHLIVEIHFVRALVARFRGLRHAHS